MRTRILVLLAVAVVLGALGWGAMRMVKAVTTTAGTELPATKVRRGRVTITVAARGSLQGGNSEMLVVPPTGADSTAITYLREPGDLVKEGDVVAECDTTLQEYTLREAEADLAEAEQQVIQAEANQKASDEENNFALLQAQSDVTTAELDVRGNPVASAMDQRINNIALEAAQLRLKQAQRNLANKSQTASAGVDIQKAVYAKAKVTADMARKTIEGLTIKAKTAGYVNIQPNMNFNMIYSGMVLQPLQVGDTVYSGMAVAQIPDMKEWEVSARVGELDRGHIEAGQQVTVEVVALPGKVFPGRVKLVGGTSGPSWDRHFECRISLENPAPEMRPGMTSNMVITVGSLDDVLWIPSQALYESDGKTFVYLKTPQGFMPHDVTLVNRSESQAVIKGLNEGELVAMSNPTQQNKPAAQAGGALNAIQK
ncbi:MAG TPA: efflux RND transporter periplasmic adaptor subunit [Bryobacteraceae bacterium]|nr:efflux RND transporter periplasmic adaptor subunit [Bryobacteraceae bacterium]